MKTRVRRESLAWPAAAFGWVLMLMPPLALAEQEGQAAAGWRGTWDEVLLWINFGIMVFLFLKYARKPLMAFLHSRKTELSQDEQRINDEKAKALARVEEIEKALAEGETRMADIKKRIVEQGERRKQEIINEAKEHSRNILEQSTRKIDQQIMMARKKFRNELVDAAIELALQQLPSRMKAEDYTRTSDRFVEALHR